MSQSIGANISVNSTMIALLLQLLTIDAQQYRLSQHDVGHSVQHLTDYRQQLPI